MAARRRYRGLLAVPLLCMGLALTGCESFDPAYLFPDTKKKLPGERRDVFPDGRIPGVTQGIPPEMIKGNPAQQAAENPAPVQQAATPAPEEKPKAKARPRKQTASRPAAPDVAQDEPQTQQRTARPASSGNWPAPQPGQIQRPPQAAQQQQPPAGSAWPAPPASGTFTR